MERWRWEGRAKNGLPVRRFNDMYRVLVAYICFGMVRPPREMYMVLAS